MMFDYQYLGLKSHKIDENKQLSKIVFPFPHYEKISRSVIPLFLDLIDFDVCLSESLLGSVSISGGQKQSSP